MRVRIHRQLFPFEVLVAVFCCGFAQVWANPAPAVTQTNLVMASSAGPVSSGGSLAAGTVMTLTAGVTSGSTKLKTGQVNFCDASAKYCTDIHLVGTAQLTSAGTAVFRFIPAIGAHSYNAVFRGTPNSAPAYALSTSDTVTLAVTGTFPTTTAISASGSAGNYSLTAAVTGLVNAASVTAPAGTVSFLDTTNSNFSLGTASLGTGAEALNFLNSSNLATTGGYPWSVVVADFNGDGTPDLAAINSSTVTILLGNGDGTFTQATNSPITVDPQSESAAVGDFNGDGIPDLAVASWNDGTVTILLSNGDGTFRQATNSPVTELCGSPLTAPCQEENAVVAGDFNGDGILDLAVLGYQGSLTVLLGKGDGTFTQLASGPVSVGTQPTAEAVGDFNGDGILDLAVADKLFVVQILLGNGDGMFTQAANSPVEVGAEPDSLAVADFNGDGKVDLAVGNEGNMVTILLGNEDGTFTPAADSPIAAGDYPISVAVGDFNGDGIPDLAVVNNGLGDVLGTVSILLGNGDGTFTQAINSPVRAGYLPQFAAVGNFNGIGLADIAVPNTGPADTTSQVSVLLSQLTQTATATATGISPVGTGTHQVDARYPGDTTYIASVSAATGLTGVAPPSFAITGSAVSVDAGATTGNTSTITLTPAGGFTGSVALTAAITSSPANAVAPPTFSFGATTPASITGTAAGTATLTITTTLGQTLPCSTANDMQRGTPWYAGGAAALAFVLLFGVPARRRSWRSMLGMLTLLVALASGVLACSSGSKTIACPAAISASTTPGAYTVTVTGKSGTLTETGTVALTVQ